ncbi:MAG: SufD family Fe-S cluster assembly protein [Fibrobacteraceae bacterium]|nr:SufD family Fe-S cluster assembly protein [Fibrobacteraceae bacterium]
MSGSLQTLAQAAFNRLQQIGAPSKKNELWTFFPVKAIPQMDTGPSNLEEEAFPLSNENDYAALIPLAFGASRTMVKNIGDSQSEMGIIKSRDNLSHTVFNIGKSAKVSLEILDNKVIHPITAERFDINVGEGADVEIFYANPANDLPLHFRHFNIHQAANSTLRFTTIHRGNKIFRTSMDVFLCGENACLDIRMLNMLQGNAETHGRVSIYHNAPNTSSSQFVRNMLNGSAYASYDGMVTAKANCPQIHSSQLVNTLLLSDDVKVSVKPVLKIYHDDVECTHGNTCGELDAEQMFYLTSRGIPPQMAQMLLTKAFAEELFLSLPEGPAKKRLFQVLAQTQVGG